ncbi:hypothetical protein HZA75_03675 [Candidatus Roizmanbacteria bacterium]|nr:hypothetical protein [Candidatus Roizmanbacteria bacterium]
MREKTLMTTAFLANFGDIFTTLYGLRQGGDFREVGPAGSVQMAAGSFENAIMLRTLTTVVLIAGYALTRNSENIRLERFFRKGITIANTINVSVLLLNFAQIVPYILNGVNKFK